MKPFNLPSESGTIDLGEQFVSVRLIKEKIGQFHNIVVVEEKTDQIKVRVLRIGRLFGGPWPGPYPTMMFKIERKGSLTLLHYTYEWPEYVMVFFGSLTLGVIAGVTRSEGRAFGVGDMQFMLMLSLATGFVFFMFLYLDIAYFKRLVERELKKSVR